MYGQIADKLSTKETGIGFRLALCKDLVNILGGTIQAENNEFKGASFFIIIPITDIEKMSAGDNEIKFLDVRPNYFRTRQLTINKSIRLPGFNIKGSNSPTKVAVVSGFNAMNSIKSEHMETIVLIVDDMVSNIFVIKMMLTKMKIKFDTANNGEEAVKKVVDKGKSNFTLILMDINMPIMNGIEATKKILAASKNGSVPVIPIIALSAQGEDTIINEAMAAGVREFIEKPIAKDKLESLIKRYEWE